jgi:hypothetical protein
MTETEVAAHLKNLFERVNQLSADGWTVVDGLELVEVSSPAFESEDALTGIYRELIAHSRAVNLTVSFGDAYLVFAVHADGTRSLSRRSEGDLADTFGPKDVPTARTVWAGNRERLGELPGAVWSLSAEIQLNAFAQGSEHRWLVVRNFATAQRAFASLPCWRWGELFGSADSLVIVAGDLDAKATLQSEAILLCGPHSDDLALESDLVAGNRFGFRFPVLESAPDPSSIVPKAHHGSLDPFARLLAEGAATLSWLAFATDVRPNETGLLVEIFGFRRVSHVIPRDGIDFDDVQAKSAINLFEWAGRGASIDHLLAVRQVASLNVETPPWLIANDIRMAAEPIFTALRSDAVADVMKMRREVHALASGVALQSAERSAAIARSSVERALAFVVAAVGVFVAQSVDAISPALAEILRDVLAGAFALVGVWNLFVEGPFATAPIRAFRADLPVFARLLSERELDELRELSSVASASRRGWIVRIAVPAMFLALAAVVWLI